MFWKAIGLAALAILFGSLTAADGRDGDGDDLYLVDVYGRRDIGADATKSLAPALLATRDAGGVLKGSDSSGKPVISVPAENLDKIRKSRAVRSVSADVPKDWRPVRRLKLSYKRGDGPNGDELGKLGLKLIEDYQKGRFMVVEPMDGRIDTKLMDMLEGCPKVEYVAPLFQARAIEPYGR